MAVHWLNFFRDNPLTDIYGANMFNRFINRKEKEMQKKKDKILSTLVITLYRTFFTFFGNFYKLTLTFYVAKTS